MKILLQGTPAQVDLSSLQQRLEQLPDVRSVHDLNLWSLDGTQHVLTLHAVVDENLQLQQAEEVKQRIRASMADMAIHHVTVELELPGEVCSQQSCTPDFSSG